MDKLALLGIHDLGAEVIAKTRFVVHDAAYFAIRDGFPRLTPDELVRPAPPAISQVNYTLDVPQLEPFRMSEAELDDFRRRMVSA